MKLLAVSLASLALASAAAVTKKANYDNFKVYRVDVGSDPSKLGSVIDKLQLSTWKGKVETSKVVDVVVPPASILQFEAGVNGLGTRVLHENLGASIADEESFGVYGGVEGIYPPVPKPTPTRR
jgi:carboxypeptidase A4